MIEYNNSKDPKLAAWISAGAILLGFALYFVFMFLDDGWLQILAFIGYAIMYAAGMIGIYKSAYCRIDEQERTIFTNENKKYPIKVDAISYVMYKESKKGRFRSLFIHDTGVGFITIRTSRSRADMIVTQLLSMNPSIEVRHANYL